MPAGSMYSTARDTAGYPAFPSWVQAHCHVCGHPVWLNGASASARGHGWAGSEWAYGTSSLLVCHECPIDAEAAAIRELAGVRAAERRDRDPVAPLVQYLMPRGQPILLA